MNMFLFKARRWTLGLWILTFVAYVLILLSGRSYLDIFTWTFAAFALVWFILGLLWRFTYDEAAIEKTAEMAIRAGLLRKKSADVTVVFVVKNWANFGRPGKPYKGLPLYRQIIEMYVIAEDLMQYRALGV